jgi:DHA1 family tetracycline resistance protein-like MFS transporter
VLVGANTVFGFFVFRETLPMARRREFRWRRANPFGAFAALGRLPGQGRMMLVVLFQEMAFIVYPVVWAYFTLEQFGWGPGMVGLSLAGYGLLLALMQGVLIRWMVVWFGEYRTAVFGLSVAVISFIFTSWNPYGWLGFAFLPIMSLGALATPAIQGMMSRAVPDDAQGELQGIISSIRAVAMIFGPLLMTGLFSYFTRQDAPFHFPGAPFVLSMIFTLAALGALFGADKR